MSREKILIVEDDKDIIELLRYNLVKEGFLPTAVTTGEKALMRLEDEPYALALIDIMLPGMDGLDVCRRIKEDEKLRPVSVIMLTAKGEESDIVAGLELGADDYIVKPFSPKVVAARIRTVLRRKRAQWTFEEKPLQVENIYIHPGKREVFAEERRIELTNLEFMVLYFLAKKPGWVFSRYQIVDGVRGNAYPVTERSVDVLIVSLRRKLGASGRCIETVRGVGYRFRSETGDEDVSVSRDMEKAAAHS
ncbi:MAG: response regulator transcription factor [Chitinispirillaceae bacterium]|nr:response regulator transcription factor [Chitinispirillaceae bacterium]